MSEKEEKVLLDDDQEELDPVDIIAQMRETTVPKDKYKKLEDQNRKLMNALANGETLKVEAPNTPDINTLRQAYHDTEDKTNLQIAIDTLALRNALIEDGQPDPFLPNGKTVDITDQDKIDAQRVADLLEYAINQADGDSQIFTATFASKLIDTTLPMKRKR